MFYKLLKRAWQWVKTRQPIFIENSRVPALLSYIAPINIGAIAFGPFVWSRSTMDARVKRHETIHFQQQVELFFVFQWLLYIIFWLINVVKYKDGAVAYRQSPFEREAYANEHDEDYLINRPFWGWQEYIKDEA
jgi:hypothetical protein